MGSFKRILFIGIVLFAVHFATAQKGNFVEWQKSNSNAKAVFKLKEDTLKKQFAAAGISWPASQIYIRSFKFDSQMELWVRNSPNEKYKLFKTYKICALSGSLGPKRMEGDYQVPEGFYYVNIFKPSSTYHMALGINYPNISDEIKSDSVHPGGDIYIHGSCVTVGCIPIMDNQIEELYIIASYARQNGQEFIPVHIFPIRFNVARSIEYFNRVVKEDNKYLDFVKQIKPAFDYFEENKKLPFILVNKKGEYVVSH